MKKGLKTWVFAAVVAVVVGYAWYDYRSIEKEAKVKDEQSLLLKTPTTEITGFQISGPQGLIELKKQEKVWKLTQPIEDLADVPAVEQFLEGVATEKSSEVAVEGDSIGWSDFGLDSPKGKIQFTFGSGESVSFEVGARKNFQGDAFLRRNQENKVYIASSTWFPKVEKTALDFRDKRLMRFPIASIDRLQFEKNKSKFELIKKDGNWISNQHPDWKLDQNKVREVLTMLNATSAIEFIAEGAVKNEELQKWGLVHPSLTLTVEMKDLPLWTARFAAGRVHRVQVSDPQFVLKISPPDSEKFQQLSEDSFRDRSEPFQFNRDNVDSIEIRIGKESRIVQKSESFGAELVGKLSKLKVADFQTADSPKLENEVVLKTKDGKDEFRLQWGHLRSTKVNGESVSVFDAKTSAFSKAFLILENDISALSLNDKKNADAEKIPAATEPSAKK